MNAALAVVAVAVLMGSGAALAITSKPHGDTEVVVVCGNEYAWSGLPDAFALTQFEANGVQYSGVKISDIVNSSGLANPEAFEYELVSARDGYSKTVGWSDLLNGYLVPEYENRAVFPAKTKSYWVDNIGEINQIDG